VAPEAVVNYQGGYNEGFVVRSARPNGVKDAANRKLNAFRVKYGSSFYE